jgi:Zn-dependent M28 family amino/carboxypeptidase
LEEAILEKEIRQDVAFLASDRLEGRMAGQPGAAKAAEHIREAFKKAGLKPPPGMAGHRQPFTFSPRMEVRGSGRLGQGDWKSENVLGWFEGGDPKLKTEVVIVGAHFDHIGKVSDKANPGRIGGAEGGDEIFNGGNDNASGCAALLAIARALGTGRLQPRRSLLLIAFAGEEQGLLGSRHYCANPVVAAERTFAMLNMDSVGRMRDEKNGTLHAYQLRTSPDWRGILEPIAERAGVKLSYFQEPWPSGLSSDHVPFASKRIKSIGFFTGVVPERHTVKDEADRVDHEGLARIARMVLLLALELADRTANLRD